MTIIVSCSHSMLLLHDFYQTKNKIAIKAVPTSANLCVKAYKTHMYLYTTQSQNHLIELYVILIYGAIHPLTCSTGTNIRLYKLTLSRIMSISEYFIPLTSTGVSLEKRPKEKWWEQRARIGPSSQAITHMGFLLWMQLNVTVWWQMFQLRSTVRVLNQTSWCEEEKYHPSARSSLTYCQGCYESTAFNMTTGVSVCELYATSVSNLTGRGVHTALPCTQAAPPEWARTHRLPRQRFHLGPESSVACTDDESKGHSILYTLYIYRT